MLVGNKLFWWDSVFAGTEELGQPVPLRTGHALAYTIESQNRIPQYLLQLLCVMCAGIQSRVGWSLCQVLALHAGGEVEKVGKGLSLAFSKYHFKWK